MQQLLDRFHVVAADVPVLLCRGDVVLRNPSNCRIGECLGFNEGIGRPPYLLETSRPGVFAVGDVRSGNVKCVASAVGEGSIA